MADADSHVLLQISQFRHCWVKVFGAGYAGFKILCIFNCRMIQTVPEFSEQVMLVSKYSAYSNVGWSRLCRKFTKEIVAGYAGFKIAHSSAGRSRLCRKISKQFVGGYASFKILCIFECWMIQTEPENCRNFVPGYACLKIFCIFLCRMVQTVPEFF
jgi:hypothetical protein